MTRSPRTTVLARPAGAPLARPAIVLASASAARSAMLRAAGVAFETVPPAIDEPALRIRLRDEGADAARCALALAEAKALAVSRRRPGRLVVGADQILVCGGQAFDKPADRAAARAQLAALSGRTHAQLSAACVVRDEARLWTHVGEARLAMRSLSESFIESYLDAVGDRALAVPGAYQIEAEGAQLFTRIDGDSYTVLGLPLLALLEFLREAGALAA
jgi:septum formation protein